MRITILIIAAAATSAVSLHGQIPGGTKLIADVPFTFHQGASVMPAGRYELTNNGPRGSVIVANAKTRKSAISLFNSRIGDASSKGFLSFHCYGGSNKCFLRQIAVPGSALSMEIGAGKLEREYKRSGSPRVAYVETGRTNAAAE